MSSSLAPVVDLPLAAMFGHWQREWPDDQDELPVLGTTPTSRSLNHRRRFGIHEDMRTTRTDGVTRHPMGTDQRVVIERLDEVIRDRIEGVRSALAALCSTDSFEG